MAVSQILIGGKSRPILFGTEAFRMRKQHTGKGVLSILTAIGQREDLDASFNAISEITYFALRLGERKAGIVDADKYDDMDVQMWIAMMPDGQDKLSEMIAESIPKPQAGEGESEPGEAQVIGIGTNSKSAQVG